MDSNLTSIIGISCLLPKANNPEEFWQNLLLQRHCITPIPKDRLFTNALSKQLDSITCMEGGFIAEVAAFDRQFFGISPNEAKQMDPQHRLALQQAWHCLEDANLDLRVLQQTKTGVFAAQMSSDYLQLSLDSASPVDQYTCIGNYESSLANRISHHLKLSGPSITLNTACAGSLVAVHQARQSLLAGECEYALVVSANIICHPLKHLSFSMAGMLSRTGLCHTFAAQADGYVPGEGVIAILLCKETLVSQQQHRSYGSLLASGINHNAGTQSITAPSLDRQAQLLHRLYQEAMFPNLDYIELHGTGTSLGDPIEYQALQKALGPQLKKTCFLGSVKTSIGHLEASAGLAGLVKILLMLHHELIVPGVSLQTTNPLLNFEDQYFQLSTKKTAWPARENSLRIAGISSMGFGGVNAHVVVADVKKSNPSAQKEYGSIPLLISVKSEASLDASKANWLSFLTATDANISDLCLASLYNRSSLDYRFAYFNEKPSKQNLAQALQQAVFSPKQDLPYLLLDEANWEISKQQWSACSLLAKTKIQALDNPAFKLHAAQKITLKAQIYILDLLKQANCLYSKVICTNSHALGILYYLDCLSLEELATHLNAQTDLCIRLTNLKNPLIIGEHAILNAAYLQELFQASTPSFAALRTFLSEAKVLFQHQYTFKGLLSRWQNQLKKYNIDLFFHWDILEHTVANAVLNPTEFLILMTLVISLEKLRKTWGLTYCIHDPIMNKPMHDLAYLFANNMVDEEDLVAGFITKQMDSHALCAKVHAKLTHLEGLPFLRSKTLTIPYTKNLDAQYLCEQYKQQQLIYLGQHPREELIPTLVKQWVNGQNINWSLFYSKNQCEYVQLPKTTFNLNEKFWNVL